MSDPLAQSLANQALALVKGMGIPLTGKLQDKTTLGSFYVRTGVVIGTGDTTVSIALGRVPSCYLVVRNNTGNVIYDGSTPSAWTSSSITLRATNGNTTVSLLIG